MSKSKKSKIKPVDAPARPELAQSGLDNVAFDPVLASLFASSVSLRVAYMGHMR
jgi:hypothetical protein